MDVYIDCFNKLQLLRSAQNLARYADWVKDLKKGSDRKESPRLSIYAGYGILHNELPGKR